MSEEITPIFTYSTVACQQKIQVKKIQGKITLTTESPTVPSSLAVTLINDHQFLVVAEVPQSWMFPVPTATTWYACFSPATDLCVAVELYLK